MKCWALQWKPLFEWCTVMYSDHEEECWKWIEEHGTGAQPYRVVRCSYEVEYIKEHRNDRSYKDRDHMGWKK